MRRLRLKADGRIVELSPAGSEAPLVPDMTAGSLPSAASLTIGTARAVVPPREQASSAASVVRELRLRANLTQTQFAARLGVPVDTIRNWEQGKRDPRGPARALLKVIEHAPDIAFAALAPWSE